LEKLAVKIVLIIACIPIGSMIMVLKAVRLVAKSSPSEGGAHR
jgi:hypothetical protein